MPQSVQFARVAHGEGVRGGEVGAQVGRDAAAGAAGVDSYEKARRMWDRMTRFRRCARRRSWLSLFGQEFLLRGEGLAGARSSLWPAFVDEDVDVDLVGFL